MTSIFCNRCGHRNPEGSNFCSSCGAVLERLSRRIRPSRRSRSPPVEAAGEVGDEEVTVSVGDSRRGRPAGRQARARTPAPASPSAPARPPSAATPTATSSSTTSPCRAVTPRSTTTTAASPSPTSVAQRHLPQPGTDRAGRHRTAETNCRSASSAWCSSTRCKAAERVAERSHLSIGEVLSLLREEFPDVTISKIRFLESQGLRRPGTHAVGLPQVLRATTSSGSGGSCASSGRTSSRSRSSAAA